jgi:Arc/MetJ family transcription regulator
MHRKEVLSVRTTLNLDENLLKEVMTITGAKTKTQAIHLAMAEFIRQRRLEGLKTLSGKIHLNLDWRELEEQELKAQEGRERRWRGHR